MQNFVTHPLTQLSAEVSATLCMFDSEMQKRKKIARMNISAPKISTKNAYFATFGNLRQNSVNSLELNQVALMFAQTYQKSNNNVLIAQHFLHGAFSTVHIEH